MRRFSFIPTHITVIATALLCAVIGSGPSAAATLYGAAHPGGADAASTLYEIDPTTGAATPVGPIGFNSVGGMDFQPATGMLYAVGKRPADNENVLITIDPETGAGSEVGPLVNISTVGFGGLFDLTIRDFDGALFLAAINPLDNVSVYDVDPSSGEAVEIGDTLVAGAGNGLSSAPDHVLFLTSGPTLYTVDAVTGLASSVASLSFVGFPTLNNPRLGAMDHQPGSGLPFVVVNDGSAGAGPNYLATMDTATGSVTQVGVSQPGLDALAWAPTPPALPRGELYGAAHPGGPTTPSTFYRIDPDRGFAAPIGPVGFNSVGGMDFQPVTRRLYAVAKRSADGVDVLITIDRETGSGSEVGPLVNTVNLGGGGHFDLSFRNSDGQLFLSVILASGSVSLFNVDIRSGVATEVGDTLAVDAGNGLGFSSSDTLFLASSATLYTLDQLAGQGTPSASLSFLGFPSLSNPRLTAIDFESRTGIPYGALNDGSAGSGPNYLAFFDTATGNVVHIGRSADGLTALAWLPEQDECDIAIFGAAHGGSNSPSTLYALDPASGLQVEIGPIGFNAVGGLDFDPLTGQLYGVAKRPADGVNVLITIDKLTGLGTEVGPLVSTSSIGGGHFDISFRNIDGRLFLTANNPTFTQSLYHVDLVTGFATEIGDTTTLEAGNALGFSLSDTLFHVDDLNGGTLHVVDQRTGVSTSIGALTYLGFPQLDTPRPNALDFDPSSGVSFLVVNAGSAGSGPNYLSVLDTTTSNVTNIGQSVNGLDAIAVLGGCEDGDPCTLDSCSLCQAELYGLSHSGPAGPSTLYRLDPASGAHLEVGTVGFQTVGGVDAHPETGILYGVAKRPADGIDVTIIIDPGTGDGTEVGPLVNTDPMESGGHYDLSFRNADGSLFLTALDSGGNVSLFVIDLLTGEATEIGDTGTVDAGQALAFSLGDTLHLADDANGGALYTVNQATGLATFLTALTYTGFPTLIRPRPNAMDVHPCTDVEYASVNDGAGGGGPNYLATVDTTTGIVTQVGLTIDGLDALTWQVVNLGACSHEDAGDTDSDGFCDPIDNCPQVSNPSQGPAPLGQTMLAPTKVRFDWTTALDVFVVNGDLTALSTYGTSAQQALALATGFGAPDSPSALAGFYYLARPDCLAGSWTSGGSGECAVPGACPPGERDGNLP